MRVHTFRARESSPIASNLRREIEAQLIKQPPTPLHVLHLPPPLRRLEQIRQKELPAHQDALPGRRALAVQRRVHNENTIRDTPIARFLVIPPFLQRDPRSHIQYILGFHVGLVQQQTVPRFPQRGPVFVEFVGRDVEDEAVGRGRLAECAGEADGGHGDVVVEGGHGAPGSALEERLEDLAGFVGDLLGLFVKESVEAGAGGQSGESF